MGGMNKAVGAALALVGAVFAGAAQAQLTVQPAATSLPQVPGLNVAQSSMAGSIATVCPTLAAPLNQPLISGDTADLRNVCTRMVQTANGIVGAGATTNSYGLTAGQLGNALQQITGDELVAPREQLSNVQAGQTSAISGRLAALRLGGGAASTRLGAAPTPQRQRYAMAGAFTPSASAGASDVLSSPWSGFLNGSGNWGDQDATATAEGFDFNSGSLTAGVDYRLNDNLIIGVAAGYGRFDADFDATANSASGQGIESDNGLLSLYGTYYVGERLYFDAILTGALARYDSTRRVVIPSQTAQPSENRTATGDFDATQLSLSLGGGYQYPIGASLVTPYVRAAYQRTDVDDFAETGASGLNLTFASHEVTSLTSAIGAQVSHAISTEFGVLAPFVTGEWIHEFRNDESGISAKYAADPTELSRFTVRFDSPDRNYFNLGAGLAVTLPMGWSAFASYDTLLGLDDVSSHTVTLGARLEF
jgi:outer membrane lipase/esterase